MKFFEHKPIDFQTVIGFGILNGISIGMLNLSLGFNSVGFYQVMFSSVYYCGLAFDKCLRGLVNRRSFFISLLDDKVGNYPLHSTPGNSFPRQNIQVSHT